jgi:hypothetical protein
MKSRFIRRGWAAAGRWALLGLLLVGCSPEVRVLDQGEASGLRKVAAAYLQAANKKGRPPSGPADLKPFLPGEDVAVLLLLTCGAASRGRRCSRRRR